MSQDNRHNPHEKGEGCGGGGGRGGGGEEGGGGNMGRKWVEIALGHKWGWGELSHDLLMTFSRLSHDFLMTFL